MNRPSIMSIIRTADTGTRPFLAMSDDSHLYWCKQLNNGHGPQSTINEVVCSVIGDSLGAPVAPWEILEVPEGLVGTRTPPSSLGATSVLDRLPVFGSRVVHSADIADSIRFEDNDDNYRRLPKLVAFWILCNAKDLQVIYDMADDKRVYSIDHGMWFGSDESVWELASVDHLYGQTEIAHPTRGMPPEHWEAAIEAVWRLDEDLVGKVLAAVPSEWNSDVQQIAELVHYCLNRRDYAAKRLRVEMARG